MEHGKKMLGLYLAEVKARLSLQLFGSMEGGEREIREE